MWAKYTRIMAKIYNVHDAKSSLSRIIEEVLAGQEVTIARAGTPLVDLSIHVPSLERAKPGFMKNVVKVNNSITDEELWQPETFKGDMFSDPQALNVTR
jgi:antitoxin (DNA-binding transcriptional repressor) of toxin-antitoxin stability system